MSTKLAAVFLAVLAIVSLGVPADAQSGGTQTADTDSPRTPQASLFGLDGLWTVISAEAMPARSFGGAGWLERTRRDPGQLTITSTGPSFFYSFTNRIQLGVRVNLGEHILSRRQDQLGLGQATLNANGYAGCRGCPLLGPPVAMPGFGIPQLRNPQTNLLTGATGYYPLYPYVNKRVQRGAGDVVVSGKINVFSEHRGDDISFSVRPWLSIPTQTDRASLLNTGAQYGKDFGGIEALLTRSVGTGSWTGDLHVNDGYP